MSVDNVNTQSRLDAIGLFLAGEYAEAAGQYAERFRDNPPSGEGYRLWGHACYHAGNHERAKNLYLKAIESSADYADVRFNLALLCLSRDDYENAEIHLHQAMNTARQHYESGQYYLGRFYPSVERFIADIHLCLGLARQGEGTSRESVDDFRAALVLHPGLWSDRRFLADACLGLKDVHSAIHELDQWRRQPDSVPEIHPEIPIDAPGGILPEDTNGPAALVKTETAPRLIGNSASFRAVMKRARLAVATDETTVLITGENGTGKELLARTIHLHSSRADRPFVAVNCAAIPENLLESELFGHEKGSFTGAIARRIGRFELAHKGTLFLDEIGDLTPVLQVKLLRVLQERSFERVGGNENIRIDVRIITATHRNLQTMMAEGTFREDLYYRINVLPIHLPPLRERKDDIGLLAEYFLRKHAPHRKITLSPSAIEYLMDKPWPGNVREFENFFLRTIVLTPSNHWTRQEIETVEQLTQNSNFPQSPGYALPDWIQATTPAASFNKIVPMDDMEAEYLRYVLDRIGWNISKSAQVLKMNRNTLYSKITKYGLKKET